MLLALSANAGLAQPLPIVEQGRALVSVCVRPDAGPWEKAAAQDLAAVVGKMTGVALPIQNSPPTADQDCIVVGELALPALRQRLQGTRRKTPILRHDAIALWSQPHRLWVAGSNDDSHYFAAAELMRRWGCRWYLPGDFGECIPPQSSLLQEPLDYAYAPPFEVRGYWLSWNGDQTGYASFAHRNFMNLERIPAGHALGPHIERVKAKLGSFESTSPEAADIVAEGLQADFSQGKSQSLSIEDATVAQLSDSEHAYNGGIRDKYFVANNISDSYLLFYQRIAQRLAAKFPHSKARLGFLAYVNLTLPPQRQLKAAAPLICYLAPIDIDPNHSDSPPKQDYFGALARWVQVMQGRVVIYDYDQSMLVWRDLPNPSQHVFQNDVKKYRKLGILGLDTESRGALATTFLNLYFRGQLMWNPDLDVDRELREFYPNFFGPAAQPMAAYWGRIYEAWKNTPVLEHEYFVIPHVYPRTLVSQLQVPAAAGVGEPYATRLRFAGLCHYLLDGYTRQLEAMASADFSEAARIARACLAAREKLTDMSPTFTTYRKYPESGPAFWTGEAAYLEELNRLVAGPQGKLVRASPRHWDFRWDLDDHGLWQNWANDRSNNWTTTPVDRYLLPQGGEPRTGFAWYRWRLRLTGPEAALPLHLAFPGLFNSSWLYVDGNLQASRNQQDLWWREDYRFLWDIDLSGKLHAGDNWICLRTRVPLHLAGIFQPPFVYHRLAP